MQTFVVNYIWILLLCGLAQNYLFNPFDWLLLGFVTDILKYQLWSRTDRCQDIVIFLIYTKLLELSLKGT